MNPTTAGRTDATRRRQQKILNTIDQAQRAGADLSVSEMARHAGVDRSYFYRHREVLEHLHHAQAAVPAGSAPALSRASLQADLANAYARANRLHNRVQLLERRLSELMGQQAWNDSGLGAPLDIEALQHTISTLEQRNTELLQHIEDRDRDLTAARAANRELMIRLNAR